MHKLEVSRREVDIIIYALQRCFYVLRSDQELAWELVNKLKSFENDKK